LDWTGIRHDGVVENISISTTSTMAESVKALRSQRHLEVEGEDFFQKAKRKIKEEPFINLGR
jgi:hypothetical protein